MKVLEIAFLSLEGLLSSKLRNPVSKTFILIIKFSKLQKVFRNPVSKLSGDFLETFFQLC